MSTILDTLLSLCLVYLVFAIVVTGVQEWVAQAAGKRGKFLRMGMARLIDDEAIFARVLQHPLVGGLYRDRAARGKPPSYVDTANFALALANVIVRRANPPQTQAAPADNAGEHAAAAAQPLTYDTLRVALQNLAAQRSPVAYALLPIVDNAKQDLALALRGIEQWYSGGMDRVSGWYKASAQKSLFVIGLLLALLANIDSIAIFQALNRSPDLRAQLAKVATDVSHSGKIGDVDLAALSGRAPTEAEWKSILQTSLDASDRGSAGRLPIGYGCLRAFATPATPLQSNDAQPADSEADTVTLTSAANAAGSVQSTLGKCIEEVKAVSSGASISDWMLKVLGLAITALAGVLGAPYWFAALSKVVNVRGSGPKPQPVNQDDQFSKPI